MVFMHFVIEGHEDGSGGMLQEGGVFGVEFLDPCVSPIAILLVDACAHNILEISPDPLRNDSQSQKSPDGKEIQQLRIRELQIVGAQQVRLLMPDVDKASTKCELSEMDS
jgi:hypothetical protein